MYLFRKTRLATLVLGLTFASAQIGVNAQTPPILSGSDRFHPVIADNGMVSSQEALATNVGVSILERGGNAVDAAVAVGFALAVTLPRAGNLGGGGFMMIHRAAENQTIAVDYRERAPASATRDMFLDSDGNADSDKSRYSGLAVGVPGTVAGLAEAHAKYGSGTLSLADLIEPAIRLAEDGFPVSVDLAYSLSTYEERLKADPDAAKIFFHADGKLYQPGETLKQPELAASLKAIASEGSDAFYKGPIAKAIADRVTEIGGAMQPSDLADYQPVMREPVKGTYRGYEIHSMPPPSSGGIHIVQILNILEGFPLGYLGHNSADTIHLMVESMKRAYADRSQFLGDPDFVTVPAKGLTSKEYAADLRALISPNRATPAADIKPGDPTPYESNETTHFSVVDKDGNAVSNTYTLNFSYGVRRIATGTGILLNNELDDFSAKAGVANAYGLLGGKANAVEAGKRPLSSMSPTLVFKDGKLVLATGSPGGSRIITTVLQILLNVIDHGMNIAEATNALRIHHQWLPDEIRIESGLNTDTIRLLEQKGHAINEKSVMGSTQSILVDGDRLHGAADPRRPGALAAGH